MLDDDRPLPQKAIVLKEITAVRPGIQALEAVGTITADDYEQVLAPLVDRARRTGRRMRLLYQFGPGFERITPGALWADTRLGLRYLQMLDGCGAVSAPSIPTRSRSSSSAAPCGLYAGSISNSYQVEELLLGFGSTGTEQEEAAFGQSVKRAVA